jgi:hypothetical protein
MVFMDISITKKQKDLSTNGINGRILPRRRRAEEIKTPRILYDIL